MDRTAIYGQLKEIIMSLIKDLKNVYIQNSKLPQTVNQNIHTCADLAEEERYDTLNW